MNKIKFTTGELNKISDDYYNLSLINNGKIVYKATVPNNYATKFKNKYGAKIKMI